MQNDPLISRMQNRLLAFEGIFFDVQEKMLDIDRLAPESERYDARYENLKRRKEIHTIVLLDEILYVRHLSGLESAERILTLEKHLYSPGFYRDLIFGRPLSDFRAGFDALMDNFINNIEILELIVTDEGYEGAAKALMEMDPPPCKNKFVKELRQVQEFLGSKKELFLQEDPRHIQYPLDIHAVNA